METEIKTEIKKEKDFPFTVEGCREKLESLKSHENLAKIYYHLMDNNPSHALPYHGNIHSSSVGLLMYISFENSSFCEVATIAGLLHDYAHTGKPDKDSNNIEIATEEVKNKMTELSFSEEDITNAIQILETTRYPYLVPSSELLHDGNLGVIKLAIRLSDLSWQNLFPLPINSMGIHKEQYPNVPFSDILTGSEDFLKKEKEGFIFLNNTCPNELKKLYELLLKI